MTKHNIVSEYLITLILKKKDYSLYFINFKANELDILNHKVFINIYCLVSKGQSEFMMELVAIALLGTTSFVIHIIVPYIGNITIRKYEVEVLTAQNLRDLESIFRVFLNAILKMELFQTSSETSTH